MGHVAPSIQARWGDGDRIPPPHYRAQWRGNPKRTKGRLSYSVRYRDAYNWPNRRDLQDSAHPIWTPPSHSPLVTGGPGEGRDSRYRERVPGARLVLSAKFQAPAPPPAPGPKMGAFTRHRAGIPRNPSDTGPKAPTVPGCGRAPGGHPGVDGPNLTPISSVVEVVVVQNDQKPYEQRKKDTTAPTEQRGLFPGRMIVRGDSFNKCAKPAPSRSNISSLRTWGYQIARAHGSRQTCAPCRISEIPGEQTYNLYI